MKLSFFGADQCVTGSCHCLEVGGKRILIDCGLQQGRDEVDNRTLPFAPGSIDYVLITHAHIDHSGRVPMLIKNGFQGRILTTRLTAQLMSIMLQDSAHIQESDAEYKNRKNRRAGRPEEEPLYTVADAQRVPEFIDTCEYDQPVHLCDGVDAVFIDAGHLLGSASIRLTLTEGGETRTIVFSGDIGNVDQPIIRDPQFFTGADYVVMESTYGDRNHTEVWSYTGQLAQIIDETLGKGGNVVIPSFAVGRTPGAAVFHPGDQGSGPGDLRAEFPGVCGQSPGEKCHHHFLRRSAGLSGPGRSGAGEGRHPYVQFPGPAPDGDRGRVQISERGPYPQGHHLRLRHVRRGPHPPPSEV